MNFGIIGSQGRMGKELQAWFEAQGHQISYRKDLEEEILKANPECLIDFSKASALEETLILAHRFSCPLVLGTTALQEEHWDLIRQASKELAIFYSANYSMGIQLFHRMLRAIKDHIQTWSVEMLEIHHCQKKDKPSGTALALQESLGQKLDIHSLRMEGVPGEHSLILTQAGEVLRIEHQALSRTVFAQGALLCALWLMKQKPGLFSMDDYLSQQKGV